MNRSRRAFLATGVLGVAVLAAGGWLRGLSPRPAGGRALDGDAMAIVGALVPAFLAGALPAVGAERTAAITETVTAVDTAVAGLPPAAQSELRQLFALMDFAPTRVLVAGLWSDWTRADTSDVQRTLARWQESRVALLRSAYDGLHQLILAAWYGSPRAWTAIGYAGPPRLG